MSVGRSYGERRSQAAWRGVTSVRVTSSGPEEGHMTVHFNKVIGQYVGIANYKGVTFSAVGKSEVEAKRKCFERIAELKRVKVSDVAIYFGG